MKLMYSTDSIKNMNSFKEISQNAYNNSDSTSGSSDYYNEDFSTKLFEKCKHNNQVSKKIFYQEKKGKSIVNNQRDWNNYKTSLKRQSINEKIRDNSINKVSFCQKCNELIVKFNDKKRFSIISKSNSEMNNNIENPIGIYFNMLEKENRIENYLFYNDYNSKRKELINLLENLIKKYDFSIDTYFLSITLLDEIFRRNNYIENNEQLLTIACLFLAGKFLDNDPKIGDFNRVSNKIKNLYYSKEEIKKCEIFCLKSLDYNLSLYTAKQYYDIFCVIGFIFKDEINFVKDVNETYDKGNKILKEIISDFQSTKFSNISIAFSVLRYIRESSYLEKRNKRIDVLEKLFKINPDSYKTAWKFIKKLKNLNILSLYPSFINTDNSSINSEIKNDNICNSIINKKSKINLILSKNGNNYDINVNKKSDKKDNIKNEYFNYKNINNNLNKLKEKKKIIDEKLYISNNIEDPNSIIFKDFKNYKGNTLKKSESNQYKNEKYRNIPKLNLDFNLIAENHSNSARTFSELKNSLISEYSIKSSKVIDKENDQFLKNYYNKDNYEILCKLSNLNTSNSQKYKNLSNNKLDYISIKNYVQNRNKLENKSNELNKENILKKNKMFYKNTNNILKSTTSNILTKSNAPSKYNYNQNKANDDDQYKILI